MKQLTASHLGLPPPAPWTLYDAHRAVGWTTDRAVGFHGFADQTEAIHAAWVAYRALAGRLAREEGTRAVPIDTESLSVWRHGDRELILAGGRAIATLVRPGKESPSGPYSFGFQVNVPQPANELRVRALAHLMYRTLRKSGVRWTLWRADSVDAVPSATQEATGPASALVNGVDERTSSPDDQNRRRTEKQFTLPTRESVPPFAWMALAVASASLLLLALILPQGIGVALAVAGLAVLAVFRVAAMTSRWLPRRPNHVRETGS